jgi:hypothetical protein
LRDASDCCAAGGFGYDDDFCKEDGGDAYRGDWRYAFDNVAHDHFARKIGSGEVFSIEVWDDENSRDDRDQEHAHNLRPHDGAFFPWKENCEECEEAGTAGHRFRSRATDPGGVDPRTLPDRRA